MPTKPTDQSTVLTRSSQTTTSPDCGGQSENTLRRSKRLESIPAVRYHQEIPEIVQIVPSATMLATSAFPSVKKISTKVTKSPESHSITVGVIDGNKVQDKYPANDAHSSSTKTNISTKTVSTESDIDRFNRHKKTDNGNNDCSDIEQNTKDFHPSEESVHSGQDGIDVNLAKSRKRKAAVSNAEEAAESAPASRPKKKQKATSPSPKRQRKASGKGPKTAKERFLAASAEDTRPPPWGEPEVWAEV